MLNKWQHCNSRLRFLRSLAYLNSTLDQEMVWGHYALWGRRGSSVVFPPEIALPLRRVILGIVWRAGLGVGVVGVFPPVRGVGSVRGVEGRVPGVVGGRAPVVTTHVSLLGESGIKIVFVTHFRSPVARWLHIIFFKNQTIIINLLYVLEILA